MTGCDKVSPGCQNCYAERMARRLKAMGQPNYRNGFKVTCHEHALDIPRHWKKPRMIFVNSMGDLFHKKVPLTFIRKVFQMMANCPQHHFQVLTKRSERLAELASKLEWPANVLMGVTIENADFESRRDHLVKTKARTKFISFEPLLGPINGFNFRGIDWAIVGGESGPKARKMEEGWAIHIRDRCLESNVPFFFKQWDGVRKKKNGRKLEEKTWSDTPQLIETSQF